MGGFLVSEPNRASTWVKDILGTAVFEGVKAALLLLGGTLLSVAGSAYLSKTIAALRAYRGVLLGTGIVFTLFLAIWAYQHFNRRKPRFRELDCDFEILEKHIHYEYRSPDKIIYKRRFKLRALKDGLTRYTDKYRWTGRHSTKPKSGSGHRIELHPEQSLYQFYDVCFERQYDKNQIVETEVIWSLEDRERIARPFVSITVHEPTKLLTFTVFLDEWLGVRNIIRFHSPDIGSPKHYESATVPLTDGWSRWELKPPELQLLHHYEIRWEPKYPSESKADHSAAPSRV